MSSLQKRNKEAATTIHYPTNDWITAQQQRNNATTGQQNDEQRNDARCVASQILLPHHDGFDAHAAAALSATQPSKCPLHDRKCWKRNIYVVNQTFILRLIHFLEYESDSAIVSCISCELWSESVRHILQFFPRTTHHACTHASFPTVSACSTTYGVTLPASIAGPPLLLPMINLPLPMIQNL